MQKMVAVVLVLVGVAIGAGLQELQAQQPGKHRQVNLGEGAFVSYGSMPRLRPGAEMGIRFGVPYKNPPTVIVAAEKEPVVTGDKGAKSGAAFVETISDVSTTAFHVTSMNPAGTVIHYIAIGAK